MATPIQALPLLAPGSQVVVRDEEWLIRSVQQTRADGLLVRVIGTSELVRDQEASFFTALDDIQPLRPEDTKLVPDPTPGFRRGRLYLEALLRKTPLPSGEARLAVGHRQLLDHLDYQRVPASRALEALRPRVLIADAVGLGKTLEVGMLLSELIRRGRGDRIMVVTPRHILEQFQHELWTRFAIPLVRLDSEGIQRVRQKIPATRNPFTFYKRVIISIDTLKNAGRYRHHLEGIRWDAVVIDECHNLVNQGTLNHQLARLLAPRTDALILTSATPHNGKPESFARLVNLLDPTAIADPKHYERADIGHLYIRRHRESDDVKIEVGDAWAERPPPVGLHASAGPEEEAVFAELADIWLYPPSGKSLATGPGRSLFPYTLLKAFLSSPAALAETIENRRKTLGASGGTDVSRQAEDEALRQLAQLVGTVTDNRNAKLHALVDRLRKIGIGSRAAGDATLRAVVFSERHATLNWLADRLPEHLGLGPTAVRVLHGGLGDQLQQDIVEEFALADSPVRLLLTGDIASEGVNLHRQCYHLIHFDLPWSLITIEQRNGRIDRYGQLHPPEVAAVLLTSSQETVRGDLDVLERLLDKEHHAHRALGDAASLMGLHSASDEESAVTRALAEHRPLDEVVPDQPASGFDLMLAITGIAYEPVGTVDVPTLFDSDAHFLEEALREVFVDPDHDLDLRREPEHSLVSLVPPPDLVRRLEVLPESYLREQRVLDRLKLTSDRDVAAHSLRLAREKTDSLWPEVHFLSSQHPILDWLADKVLVGLGRNEAPVLTAAVTSPTFLLQGICSNRRGQATVVEWMAIDRLPAHPHVRPLDVVFAEARVGAGMANPGSPANLSRLQSLVPAAVAAGRNHVLAVREDRSQAVIERVRAHARRLGEWHHKVEELMLRLESAPLQHRRRKEIAEVAGETQVLIDALGTVGEPLVRIVAVLVGPS
jgi:ERCC4-related helicase